MILGTMRFFATAYRWRYPKQRKQAVKKFIMKRVDQLQPGDVVVMAHALHIIVASVRVISHMAVMRDTRQVIYPWAASYTCHVFNPEHPEHPHYKKKG